jgi:hypothetical protein
MDDDARKKALEPARVKFGRAGLGALLPLGPAPVF